MPHKANHSFSHLNQLNTGVNDKLLDLSGVDPLLVFGVNNIHLQLLQKHFPELKLIARGNQLKIHGPADRIEILESKVMKMLALIEKQEHLSSEQLGDLLGAKATMDTAQDDIILHGPGGKVVKARTPNQQQMMVALRANDMLFAIGPAGTGKTYTAVAMAVKALKNKEVKRIILTRPAVEAGENLGFLPGDLKEKLDPYLQPLYDALMDMIHFEKLEDYLQKGVIQIAPLAFMRGRTLDNAYVILDEAQNATASQMKMFLTRMGASAKFIITGDLTQVDLPKGMQSGLRPALDMVKTIEGIKVVRLNEVDVVRHKLVKRIIQAYQKQKDE